MLNNFLYRLAQWVRDNRRSLIRVALILAAILLAVFLIFAAVEKIQGWRYEKKVQALEKQFKDADAKAREFETQAAALKLARDAKQAEIDELEARAETAETALKTARQKVAPLKEAYENTRIVHVPFTPISCPDACVELAAIGYPCK